MKNRCKDGLSAHFYDEVEEQAPISVAIKSYVLKGDLASRLNLIENQLESEEGVIRILHHHFCGGRGS